MASKNQDKTCIAIGKDAISDARKLKINISKVCRDAVCREIEKRMLKVPDKCEYKSVCRQIDPTTGEPRPCGRPVSVWLWCIGAIPKD